MNFQKFYETLDTQLESLDTVSPYELTKWSDRNYQYDFVLDETHYTVTMVDLDHPAFNNIFEIAFINFEKGYKITGTAKNPLRIFGAVVNIIKDWIDKVDPRGFFFSAKEPSRIRLYNRFAKLIEQKTEYKFNEELNDDLTNAVQTGEMEKYFTFVKI